MRTFSQIFSLSGRFSCCIFVFSILLLSYGSVIAETNVKSASTSVPVALTWLLDDTNVEDINSIYRAQDRLMVPVTGAFTLGYKDWQSMILKKLTEDLNKTVTLGEIREGYSSDKMIVEDALLDPRKSGTNDRRIFPTKTMATNKPSAQKIIGQNSLQQLQFSSLISYVVKILYTSVSTQTRPLTDQEKDYIKAAFPFLMQSIVKAYWLEVEALDYVSPYRNMKERVLARLDWKNHPEYKRKSYYKAFQDVDFFVFAIASDLLSAKYLSEKSSTPIPLSAEDKKLLIDIRDMTLRVIQQRLEPNDGFYFQVGLWADHPDYVYAACSVEKLPDKECRKVDLVDDSAHFRRWPWWLQSYKDAWPVKTEQHKYYQSLLVRLAKQFVTKVAVIQDGGLVLLTNYMDGSNGWYRVNYENSKGGSGPYRLSETALMGSWYSLGPYDYRIKKLNSLFCKMVSNKKKGNPPFGIKYEGKNASKNAWFLSNDSIELIDYYGLVCRMAKELGWTENYLRESN